MPTHRRLSIARLVSAAATVASTVLLVASPTQPVHAQLELSDSVDVGRLRAGDGFICGEVSNSIGCAGLNADGQLGDGTTTNRKYLKVISDSAKVKSPQQLSVGAHHVCAVSGMTSTPAAGKLYCWGDNQYGQLGDGTTTDRNVPTLVADNGQFVNADIQGVIAGDNHTCAVTSISGVKRMFCWGLNNKGQLGNGNTSNSSLPIAPSAPFNTGGVYTGTNVNQMPAIAAGAEHKIGRAHV